MNSSDLIYFSLRVVGESAFPVIYSVNHTRVTEMHPVHMQGAYLWFETLKQINKNNMKRVS